MTISKIYGNNTMHGDAVIDVDVQSKRYLII